MVSTGGLGGENAMVGIPPTRYLIKVVREDSGLCVVSAGAGAGSFVAVAVFVE